MDIPAFHLDFLGNRMLIAVIAIGHVLINHSLAVGMIPLVVLLERLGVKNQNKEWDELARKIMFTAFLITTTLGAMTGVGIWFSASLVNPYSIGSLIRVFYGAWFVEWIVFVTEVVLILIYFLTWEKSNTSEKEKAKHIRVGTALAAFSWITMAIIVAILSFMMDPGSWNNDKTFLSGFLNPIYIPQLAFRTPLAMLMAGCVAFVLTFVYTERESEIRRAGLRYIGIWILSWFLPSLISSIFYYNVIPELMVNNFGVAIGTQAFQNWLDSFKYLGILVFASIPFVVLYYMNFSNSKLYLGSVLPVILVFSLVMVFERTREFIRKPFVIGKYMYSNGYRPEEYALLKKEGILKYATYVSTNEVTETNKVEAGKNVFSLACSRCHTTNGINSVLEKFENLYGKEKPLEAESIKTYIKGMHNARYYMPPFPGNEKEMDALARYIMTLQEYPDPLEGAQDIGISISPAHIQRSSKR
jgi:mono/diheme cytochrome c family protein